MYGKPIGILAYTLFYSIPYYIAVFIVLGFEKKLHVLKSREFWIKSLIFFALLGISNGFYWHREWFRSILENPSEVYYLNRMFKNLNRLIIFVIPMLLLKYKYDKNEKGLYGLRFDYFNYKPYLFMLAFMVPLITIASFEPSFQRAYPRIQPWFIDGIFGMSQLEIAMYYEIAYGINFTFIELFYRGALVVGMVRVLGKDAIVPMAVTYCVLHFGKPMGEAISSIFGGYILGIIAYYTRNIFGGVLIHIGVAYLMEIAAFIQHYVK